VESRESVLLMPKKSNEVGRPGVEIGNPLPRLQGGNGGGGVGVRGGRKGGGVEVGGWGVKETAKGRRRKGGRGRNGEGERVQ
jgi:hypothetical protein